MGGNGFSASKAVLVVALIAALFFVGKLVKGPPPGPPVPPKKVVGSNSPPPNMPGNPPGTMPHGIDPQTAAKMQMIGKMKMGSKNSVAGSHPGLNLPKPNPNAIDTSNAFFKTHTMGESGLKQTDAEMARAKAELDKNAPPKPAPATSANPNAAALSAPNSTK